MLNLLYKVLFGKEVILYNPHRNSVPLANAINKKRYVFVNYNPIWKLTRLMGRGNKIRYKAMSLLLTVIKPRYIIDINWISKLQFLFLVWCRNHRPSEFIVVQHGLYKGGIITDNAHKYAKCDVILCWGEQSEREFLKYNKGKNIRIIKFGNTFYNNYNRELFKFPESAGDRVLIAPTVLWNERKVALENLTRKLSSLGFSVFLKEHQAQSKLSTPIDYPVKVSGNFYEMLRNHEYDIVICDTSTSLVDSLFLKNPTLYFSPPGDFIEFTKNVYTGYLKNLHDHIDEMDDKANLYKFVDLTNQENLFNFIHTKGNNSLLDLPYRLQST